MTVMGINIYSSRAVMVNNIASSMAVMVKKTSNSMTTIYCPNSGYFATLEQHAYVNLVNQDIVQLKVRISINHINGGRGWGGSRGSK